MKNNEIDLKNYHELPIGTGGCTSCWTDRNPVTLVRVVDDRTVEVRDANWKVIKGSMQDGSAEYEFSDNVNAGIEVYTKRAPTVRNPRWSWVRKGESVNGGTRLNLGQYSKYEDPSF